MELLLKKTAAFTGWQRSKKCKYQEVVLVCNRDHNSEFSLYDAYNPVRQEKVSLWVLETKSGQEAARCDAQSAIRYMKKLIHPSVIKYLDEEVSDGVLTVETEHVIPLQAYLPSLRNVCVRVQEAILSWGLLSIFNLLRWIHENCKIIHGSVLLSSIYINDRCEWKLGGYEKMRPRVDEESNNSNCNFVTKDDDDLFKLAIVVSELFNGVRHEKDLNNPGKIPEKLQSAYRCLLSNASFEVKVRAFLKSPFFASKYTKFFEKMDNLQVCDTDEVKSLLKENLNFVKALPMQLQISKILPHLIDKYKYGGMCVEVVDCILVTICNVKESSELKKEYADFLVHLYESKDRAIRYSVLNMHEHILKLLPKKCIDEKIYNLVIVGLLDTVPSIREQTIKAIVPLAQHLSKSTIKNSLLRYLAKSQRDQVPIIRANTNVCIGKISNYLPTNILVSAFLRGARDPFPLSVKASLLSIFNTSELYTLEHIAEKLLPGISPLLAYPDHDTATQCYKTIKHLLVKVQHLLDSRPATDVGGGGIFAGGEGGEGLAITMSSIKLIGDWFSSTFFSTTNVPGTAEASQNCLLVHDAAETCTTKHDAPPIDKVSHKHQHQHNLTDMRDSQDEDTLSLEEEHEFDASSVQQSAAFDTSSSHTRLSKGGADNTIMLPSTPKTHKSSPSHTTRQHTSGEPLKSTPTPTSNNNQTQGVGENDWEWTEEW